MAGEDQRTANVNLTASTSQYNAQMTSAADNTNKVTQSVNTLITSLSNLQRTTSRKLELVSAASVATITGATLAASQFQQQISSLQGTAAVAGRNVGAVATQVDGLRRSLPITTNQVVSLVGALQKMGTSNTGMDKVVTTVTKLASVTGEDIGTLATGIVGLGRAMGTTESSISGFADTLVTLSSRLGTSASGILQFSQSLAPVARSVNMTQSDVMGFSAAFAKAGQDGYAASNVFTSMLSNISRAARYGSQDLAMYANLAGTTVDAFKSMGSTDQMLAVFSSINKAGPDALRVLDQMGIDAPRAVRAIQGVVQSGGLSQALSTANGNNTGNLSKGAKSAMDGLQDDLQTFKNVMTSLAQSFGQTFLPIADKVVQALTAIANAVRTVTAPITGLIGALTAAGGGVAGVFGGALGMLGPLSMAAGVVGLARSSLGAGFVGARNARLGRENPTWASNRMDANAAEGGSRFSRAAQTAGSFAYRATPIGRLQRISDAVPGAGQGLNVGGRAAMLASSAWQGTMGLARGSVSPLTWSRVGGRVANAGEEFQGMKSSVSSVFSRGDSDNTASMGRAFKEAAASTGRFSTALLSATAGLGRLGASAAGNVGMRAGGAALRGVGSALSSIGPVGIALMGGTLLASQISGSRSTVNADVEERGNIGADDTAYNKYATSLGLAGAAAQTFASTVQSATQKIAQSTGAQSTTAATQVTSSDTALAGTLSYSNPDIAKMNKDQATSYVSTVFAGTDASKNPQVMQATKLDLIKKFGNSTAQQIIDTASKGSVDFQPLVTGSFGIGSAINPWHVSGGKNSQLNQLQSTVNVQRAGIDTTEGLTTAAGTTENAKLTAAQISALLSQYGRGSQADDANISGSIEKALGLSKGDLKISMGDTQGFYNTTTKGGWANLQSIVSGSKNIEAQQKLKQIMALPEAQRDSTTYQINSTVPDSPLVQSQKQNAAGKVFYGASPLGTQLQSASGPELDNANATSEAAQAWAQELMKSTGSLQGTEAALDQFKGNIGNSSDSIYQLADAARTAANRIQAQQDSGTAHAPAYAATQARSNLVEAYQMPETDPNKSTTVSSAEDQYTSQRQALTSQLQGMQQSLNAYDVQVSRSEYQYGLQRTRSMQDFYLQQSRSELQFDTQRERGEEDYNLQRTYALNDFALQQSRSESDYELQRQRGQSDFDLQQKYSQQDFDKSRTRSQEDFNHQIIEMTKQTSQSMSDIYSRITVKPTWDATNLLANATEQNQQFSAANSNLKKLKDMGVSGDVIQQLGLDDPQNAQQLAKFVTDLAADPSLVTKWNNTIKGRLSLAKAFTTDNDNETYKEMTYQFDKAADRAETDFNTASARAVKSYNTSTNRMATDYNTQTTRAVTDFATQMSRNATAYDTSVARQEADYKLQTDQANADFNTMLTRNETDFQTSLDNMHDDLMTSFTTITGDISSLSKSVLGSLTGTAKSQMQAIIDALMNSIPDLKSAAGKVSDAVISVYNKDLGITFYTVDPRKAAQGSSAHPLTGQFAIGGPNSPTADTGPGSFSPEHSAMLNPTTGPSGGPATHDNGKYPLPTEGVWTSGFGMRMNPVLHKMMLHAGQDIAVPVGTRVASVRDGVVSVAGYNSGQGNHVTVNHGNGFSTEYLHLSRMEVRPGEHVTEGEEIARSGNTGNSTGPHLHFQTDYNGTPRNPAAFLESLAHAAGFSAPPTGPGSALGAPASATDTQKLSHDQMQSVLNNVADKMVPLENAITKPPGLSKELPPGMTTALMLSKTVMDANKSGVYGPDGWFGAGSVFTTPRTIGVGERGPEAVLPLNATGVEFITSLLQRYGGMQPKGQQSVSAATNYYTQHVDSSTNYTGPITVQAQDPNEMGRKLDEQARLKRLVTPHA